MKTTSEMLSFLSVKLGQERLREEMFKRRSPNGFIIKSSAAVIAELYDEHSQTQPQPPERKI